MARICPLCGRETRHTIQGLCPQCYVEKYGLVRFPEIVEYEICRYCGSIRIGDRWVHVSSFEEGIETIVAHIASRQKLPPGFKLLSAGIERYRTQPNWRTKADIVIVASYEGETVYQRGTVTVQFKPSVCPVCKIRVSGEYDTLLQVRGRIPERIEEKIVEITASLGLQDSLVDVIPSKEGVDVYFTHTGAARKLARKLANTYGGVISRVRYEDVTISSTGKHRARKTLLVRLGGKH
ncbi:MAG: 60S ribosomal export protein NMD3 [Desulfurococcales archaeon]|nr:60S ribosomal export protein NMD3 [Desulfurococcales archaeon]